MEIYLVRHGIAEEPAASLTDPQRALTPEGLEKTRRVAAAFSRRIESVDTILHSPYRRARETAEIFHANWPRASLRSVEGITPNDPPESGWRVLAQHAPGANRLMLVAHEPHLSGLASLLLTGRSDAWIQFKKAGIAGFQWNGRGNGELLFLLPPKFLL